jgi:hypothetical protein
MIGSSATGLTRRASAAATARMGRAPGTHSPDLPVDILLRQGRFRKGRQTVRRVKQPIDTPPPQFLPEQDFE